MSKTRSLKELKNKAQHCNKEGFLLIKQAYDFAEKAHKEQLRKSGEPYFNHVAETAYTLAELGMSPTVIAAGLLHDTIEDTNITDEDIHETFGGEVHFLVDGVTKLGKLRYRGAERHAESLRKLFVATSKDIRVLIIKLADRLHNIRTLEHVAPEKQHRIASETLSIYAPLAYRLGIRYLVKELEDHSFKYVYPKEYATTKALVEENEVEVLKRLSVISREVKTLLRENKMYTFDIIFRTKSLYSLWLKLKRKDMDISRVYDLAAMRIVVPEVTDCYQALGIVHSAYRPLPGRVKDYIAFPKPNGYQSIHTDVFTGNEGIVEFQIRSLRMHREAEFGIASHLTYKETGSSNNQNVNPGFLWLRQLLPGNMVSGPEAENNAPVLEENTDVPTWIKELTEYQAEIYGAEFIENLKSDFFEHRMFVFTPKGDVIDLPRGSIVVDFAYTVHTWLGNHLYGGKVNGKLVSIDTELRNGDYVEILSRESSHPNYKWLEKCKTTIAQKYIKQYLRETQEAKPYGQS